MGRTADKLSAVADELICSADLEGYFTDVNPAFTRLLGWTEPELLNVPYIDRVHPEDRDSTAVAVSSLADGGTLQGFRNRYLTKDGGFMWIDWKAYRCEDEIFAIGRQHEERRRTDLNLESVVTRVVRATALEQEEKRKAREDARAAARDAERSQKDGELEDATAEAKLALTRASTWKTWVGAAVAVAGAIGGFGVWAVNQVRASVVQAKQAEDRKAHVDQELVESIKRDELQDKKLRVLGKGQIEVQVQVSDEGEYTRGLIRASHPRQKTQLDAVEVPESVPKAAAKVKAIKDDIAIDELFNVADPADASNPFAGLDEETEKEKTP
jgi:PAS domain S-box-containing protein